MATGFIYNAFGHYEEFKGEQGINLYFGGVPFWLPYQKVTAIPNWTLREVDHDRSTPQGGTKGVLVYQNIIVAGDYIVNELCNKGVPIEQRKMGIIPIAGKPTGKVITVNAGNTVDGAPLLVEISEREATKPERDEAAQLADNYRRNVIAEYFQSKRQKMNGGQGKITPDDRTRMYMDELNVQDNDDVTTHQKAAGGIDIELIKAIVELTRDATNVNAQDLLKAVETVRHGGKAQIVQRPSIEVSEVEMERRRAFGQRMAEVRAKKDAEKQAKTEEPETVGAPKE